MLRSVHRTFEVAGVFLTHADGEPVRATARIHRKPAVDRLAFGDFNDGSAGALITENVIVFDLQQVPRPMPGTYFIVGLREGYKLGPAKPEQDGYAYVTVTEMSEKQIADLLEAHGADAAAEPWLGVI